MRLLHAANENGNFQTIFSDAQGNWKMVIVWGSFPTLCLLQGCVLLSFALAIQPLMRMHRGGKIALPSRVFLAASMSQLFVWVRPQWRTIWIVWIICIYFFHQNVNSWLKTVSIVLLDGKTKIVTLSIQPEQKVSCKKNKKTVKISIVNIW